MDRRPISHLREEFEALHEQYESTRKQFDSLRRQMPTLRGTAESPDKLVTVTVGPKGELKQLEIHPKAYRKLSPTQLAEAIIATAEKASQAVYAEVQQLLKPLMSIDAPFEQLMSGEADWAKHVRFNLPDFGNGRPSGVGSAS
jgi:DNA-binding protein YbaB